MKQKKIVIALALICWSASSFGMDESDFAKQETQALGTIDELMSRVKQLDEQIKQVVKELHAFQKQEIEKINEIKTRLAAATTPRSPGAPAAAAPQAAATTQRAATAQRGTTPPPVGRAGGR